MTEIPPYNRVIVADRPYIIRGEGTPEYAELATDFNHDGWTTEEPYQLGYKGMKPAQGTKFVVPCTNFYELKNPMIRTLKETDVKGPHGSLHLPKDALAKLPEGMHIEIKHGEPMRLVNEDGTPVDLTDPAQVHWVTRE